MASHYLTGQARDLKVDDTGALIVTGGGGGGGGSSDATAANQRSEISQLISIANYTAALVSRTPTLVGDDVPVVVHGADWLTNTQLRATAIATNVTNNDWLTNAQLRLNPVTVTMPSFPGVTDTQLRAAPVPVTVTGSTSLTDTQLRSAPVDVAIPSFSGVTDAQIRAAPVAVTVGTWSGLTDTQLRATSVSTTESAPTWLTDTELRHSPVPVQVTSPTGLTDIQLRASPVPVSGTVTSVVSNFPTPTGLTDIQLRASPVPVSGTITSVVSNFPTPTGLTNTELRSTPVPVSVSNFPVDLSAAESTQQLMLGRAEMLDLAPTVSGTAVNTSLFTFDFGSLGSIYRGIQTLYLNLSGTWVGTVSFQCSSDSVNWRPLAGVDSGYASPGISSTATTGIYMLPVCARYIRASVTSYVSGTIITSLQGSNRPLPAFAKAVVTVSNQLSTAGVASTALIGDVGMSYRPGAANSAAGFVLISAASTNATIIKASAGRLVGWHFTNSSATTVYVKLGNVATLPVPGTTLMTFIIPVPANSTVSASHPGGVGFTTGIGLWTTTLPASSDTTAPAAASTVVGNIMYA
jgi:hypothetical protein